MTKSEMPVSKLAKKYLSALESETGEEELEEARERLSELQERHSQFESDYGESDSTTQELAERVSEARKSVKEVEEAQQVPDKLEEQFLEAATRFTFSEEWLTAQVIEALNRSLVGKHESVLAIEEIEIRGPEDVTDVDDIVRFEIIDIVRKLAMDKLGESEGMKDLWESITGTKKQRPFEIIAEVGNATPKEVLEQINEDDLKRGTVSNRLRNATRLDINPYIRDDGVYRLSTPGEYLSVKYAGLSEEPTNGANELSEPNENSQRTLKQTVAGDGDANE